GLKTHCKLAMLIRHDPDGVTRRYAHLGTGNYNPNTARFYTDISLLTADPEITASVHSVFNCLTAHSESDDYAPLLVAPLTLAESTIRMIHRETEHAAAGRPAHIIAKMNSLLEQKVIEALYEASKAGVQIDLIVRGICSIRPGIRGLSENIRVRSEERRVGKECRSRCDWSSDVCSSDLALYEASKAGVQIDLIVRGICSIRPGIRGLSENIRV